MLVPYQTLQFYAIAISIISVIYNGAEGAISIVFGAESSSRSLIFFGVQSGIEVASSIIVLWRFLTVVKPGEEQKAGVDPKIVRFEKIATFTIGTLLILLGLGTIATAISILVLHEKPDSSNASLVISASAIGIMVLIWLPKRYLARKLNSSAMQGEATCSLSCIQITIVLFIGSLIYRVWPGGWWIDGATSIVLGQLFGWEGVKMIRWARDPGFDGGCCSSCRVPEQGTELEKGETRRDICKCCLEKEACMQSDQCRCSFDSSNADAITEVCCTPVNAKGEKCCSREIMFVKVPKVSPQAGDTQTGVDCHAAAQVPTTKSIGIDTCCAQGHDACSPHTSRLADQPPTIPKIENENDKGPCKLRCCGSSEPGTAATTPTILMGKVQDNCCKD